MNKYLVPEQNINEILKYLATKPYAEVYILIPKLLKPQVSLYELPKIEVQPAPQEIKVNEETPS